MNLTTRVEREFLPFVNKPGRYTGNEYHAVQKDPAAVKLRVALAFPDLYELGMSYLGYDILYHVLNAQPEIWAERVYAPWFDAESILRRQQIPLFSLESRTPLSQFDWIGFTLQYELTYSTLLNMLDLAGIPLLSQERDQRWPLIIAGGPSAYNPEPLSDFIDAFLIGDGEEAVLDICRAVRFARDSGHDRQALLRDLSKIPGIYIPSYYRVEFDSFRDFKSLVKMHPEAILPIRKRILPELSSRNYPIKPLVPLIEITHDRFSVEIMRGCSEGCRFCNAGMIYRPVRQRPVDDIIRQSQQAVQSSGFNEVSLLSLNTSDYSDLQWLMMKEKLLLSEENLSFSFPSLRLDGLTGEMVDFVRTFRKSGFTFAPEAGSQRLRNVINKNIHEDDLLNSLRLILDNGWQVVKFYFMIGLPTEKEEDLQAIADLIRKCRQVAAGYKEVRFNISISPFSPKPHTPFQWEKQEHPEVLEQKSRLLRHHLQDAHTAVSWRDGYVSTLESIFTRGGRELGAVLLRAWQEGARFDGWNEGFDWGRWEKAFSGCNMDWRKYLRPLSVSIPLPWDHIDMGVSRSFLQEEKLRAYEGKISPDCKDHVCLGCGLQRKEFQALVNCFQTVKPQAGSKARAGAVPAATIPSASFGRYTKKRPAAVPPVKKKVRMRYTKTGMARFISHLDVVRLFDRATRRAKISLVYSQGFHPRPKIAFGPPLSLGVASIAEYLDLEAEVGQEVDFQAVLNPVLPAGIQVVMQKTIFAKVPSLASQINRVVYQVFLENLAFSPDWLEEFLARDSIIIEREVKEEKKAIDLRPFIHQMALREGKLEITLDAIEGRMVKVTEILESLLKDRGIDYRALLVQRIGQFIRMGDKIFEPLEVI